MNYRRSDCLSQTLANKILEKTLESHLGCKEVKPVNPKGNEMKVAQLCPSLVTPWTIQSMEFSRPEYWSG